MLTAYIDESLRRHPDDHCVYAMAAVVMDSAHHDDIRAALESLRTGKSPRLHWREESAARQLVIAGSIAVMPVRSIVTIHIFSRGLPYERARRLCLERLLYELDQADVRAVTVESRSPKLDHLDLLLVMGIRRARAVSKDLKVAWRRPDEEPLLWSADAVAGATTWWLNGQPEGFKLLADRIRLVCLD
ncbi:hypothetical protein AB0D67_10950 [Streptosporangium sp. NPDC048047]|uniref:hypothetical protein n=1 Tax=Streptosporangium sp. NPDC048047 TaxID=3155748 RepID=UPI003442BABF